MKTFKDLIVGDRIYTYSKIKINYLTITSINNYIEKSTTYLHDHTEINWETSYTVIICKNSKGNEYKFELPEELLDAVKYRDTDRTIFPDRNAAIKHVTDLYDYRYKKLQELEKQYDKERSYIEKYKDCLKNLPE